MLGKNKGRKLTVAQCEANRVRNLGSNNYFYGCKHKIESIQKMRLAKLGQSSGKDSGVAVGINIYLNNKCVMTFYTITQALKVLELSKQTLYTYLQNPLKLYHNKFRVERVNKVAL